MKFRSSLGLLAGILLLNGNAVLAQEVESTIEVASSTTQVESTQTTEKVESTTEAATTQTQEVTTVTSTTETPKYTGWVQTLDGTWYFYKADHTMLTSSWKDNYYLEADGKMATSKWVDNYKYYVDASGKWVPGKIKEYWEKIDGNFYYYENGQPVKNVWKGDYYLQEDGVMATNKWVDNENYYVDETGKWDKSAKKKLGWIKVKEDWYYYEVKGQMSTSKWAGHYYLLADGKMAKNQWVDNNHYFVDGSGKWVPGKIKEYWEKIDGKYYYYENGQPVKNVWKGDYYLQEDGVMATNKWVDNKKYYVGSDGKWIKDRKIKEGWIFENNNWYYYEEGEQLVKNEWRGDYYLGSDGKMLKSQWIEKEMVFVGPLGRKVPNSTKQYRGWLKDNYEDWFFFENGVPLTNQWYGNYYLNSDGRMAKNQWVDNYRYYVGPDGAWLPNPSSKGNQKEILLDLARGYIGVEQFDNRHNTIVSIYNSGKSSYSGYRVSAYDDWCDIFVSAMYQQSGIIDLIEKEAYVPYHILLMKNKGIWIGKTTPQPGDVITFDWNIDGVADHIAIVEKVEGDRVITIEGNTSDRNYDESKVVRKSHKLNARYIIGYSRPQYK